MGNCIDCLLVGSLNRIEGYGPKVFLSDSMLRGSINMSENGGADHEVNGNQVEYKEFNGAIAYLGTFLYRRGFSFDYVNYIEEEYPILVDKLKSSNVMCVGISSTYCTSIDYMKKIIDSIRRVKPDIKIVIGGQYIAMLIKKNIDIMRALKKYLILMGADFYINSFQGEDTLVKLLRSIKGELSLNSVPNIFYRNGATFEYTETVPEDNNLEENMVDWNLFSKRMYKIVPVRTSISCPFNCSFCNYKSNAGNYKCVSLEAIERELDSIHQQKIVQTVQFVDDTFNIPKKRFKEILRLLVRKNYHFNWISFLRCQYLDEEEAELMRESRCLKVLLGVESGSQKILNNMNKQVTVDKLKRGVSLLNKYGINAVGSFLIGFPGETDDTIRETTNFIKEVNFNELIIQPWYYDETTPIGKQKAKYGIIGNEYSWKHSTMDYPTAQKHAEIIFSSTKLNKALDTVRSD